MSDGTKYVGRGAVAHLLSEGLDMDRAMHVEEGMGDPAACAEFVRRENERARGGA